MLLQRYTHRYIGPLFIAALVGLTFAGSVWAKEKQASHEVFLAQVFGKETPKSEIKTLSALDKKTIKKILRHPVSFQRVRYWRKGNSAVWLLEEIGKHKPIAAGFWLEHGVIKKAKVLAFRESRGWEIKYPYFLKQFKGASLQENNTLHANIDGISGATLSVRAMKKMAHIALYLNQQESGPQSASL